MGRTKEPKRVRLRRTKGFRKPAGAAYVGRPTKWGNPFRLQDFATAAECVAAYRTYLLSRDDLREAAVRELSERDLACWCPESSPCHADVLLEAAAGRLEAKHDPR